jgi:hypothetical protein
LIASNGLLFGGGTCLSAAAWTTMSTPSIAMRRPRQVADIPDKVTHAGISGLGPPLLHLVLLELVATVDDRFRGRCRSALCE